MGLLDKLKSAKNVGNQGDISAFYLQFPDLDGRPTYEIADSITIGSEVGDVLLPSQKISPRHCTVYLNQDVLSVMDHSSREGTYVGRKQIDPGKMIILMPDDKLALGKLKIKIVNEVKTVAQKSEFRPIDVPVQLPVQKEAQDEVKTDVQDLSLDLSVGEVEEIKKKKPSKKAKGVSLKKLPTIGTNFYKVKKSSSSDSSNAFLRTMAVILDLLLAGTIFTIVSVESDIVSLIDSVIPTIVSFVFQGLDVIKEIAQVDIKQILAEVFKDLEVVQTIFNDVVKSYESAQYKSFWRVLSLFVIIRLVTTMLFSVSIGQALAGIRGQGNILLKRIMGVVRELIGFLTGPFLIFDLLTFINKASLKEKLTFTRITTPSNIQAWLGCSFSLVILSVLYFASPLYRGFEPILTHEFTNALKPSNKMDENEVLPYFSKNFSMSFKKDIRENLIPSYRFVTVNNKKIAHIELTFLLPDDTIKIRQYKKFSWEHLLKTALVMNPIAHSKFPEAYKQLSSNVDLNVAFKANKLNYDFYANSVIALTNTAFNLGLENVVTYIKTYGPLLKTLADYRFEYNQLLPEKSRLEMVTNSSDSAVFVNSALNGKFYIIPITYPEGIVYEVDSKTLKMDKLINLLSKFNFINYPQNKATFRPEFNLMAFLDTIYDGINGLENKGNLQFSYEYLFQRLKNVLEKQDATEIDLWERSLRNLMELLETIKLDKNLQKPAWSKFYQNINDLLKALKERDSNYFGIKKKMA